MFRAKPTEEETNRFKIIVQMCVIYISTAFFILQRCHTVKSGDFFYDFKYRYISCDYKNNLNKGKHFI